MNEIKKKCEKKTGDGIFVCLLFKSTPRICVSFFFFSCGLLHVLRTIFVDSKQICLWSNTNTNIAPRPYGFLVIKFVHRALGASGSMYIAHLAEPWNHQAQGAWGLSLGHPYPGMFVYRFHFNSILPAYFTLDRGTPPTAPFACTTVCLVGAND